MSVLPTFSLFFCLEGGSNLSSPQWCREESLSQPRLVKCSFEREKRGHGEVDGAPESHRW